MNVRYQADADLNQALLLGIIKADFEPIITKSLPSSAQTLASQVRN
jgi:hypothetical protein